jgi:hypothetical protein
VDSRPFRISSEFGVKYALVVSTTVLPGPIRLGLAEQLDRGERNCHEDDVALQDFFQRYGVNCGAERRREPLLKPRPA